MSSDSITADVEEAEIQSAVMRRSAYQLGG